MVYKIIGTMSGSSLDGLDIVFVEFTEVAGLWSYEILSGECIKFDEFWSSKLQDFETITPREMIYLDTQFGYWMAQKINQFVIENHLEHKVHFIASHGHTAFHEPCKGYTYQIGHCGCIAAHTKLPVVCNLRQMDVALGGQGAPIVPIAEKMLFRDYTLFLNLGGICNLTVITKEIEMAFDVAPCNRVLNYFAAKAKKSYDSEGEMAKTGQVDKDVLAHLNRFDYYAQELPKSLANRFGTHEIIPYLESTGMAIADVLATYVEHVAIQITESLKKLHLTDQALLVTGGGAYNTYMIERIQFHLHTLNITLKVPDRMTIEYKEAVAMAMIGALRWREEYNVLAPFSGASHSSIGGALLDELISKSDSKINGRP